jgi:hypothetical protein
MSFIRKQHGLRRLIGRRLDVTQRLFSTYAPLVGGELGIAGMHFFTFNGLVDTAQFVNRQTDEHLAELSSPEAATFPSSIR